MAQVDCIEWTGGKTVAGYGQVMVNRKRLYVHRIAYCAANGLTLDNIKGLVVRHRCDNPACVNPAHLHTGSQAENMADMRERGRARNSPKPGSKNGNSKLTEEQVRTIRETYVKGSADKNCRTLAEQFGVDRTQIHHIVRGKQWNHEGASHGNG